MISRADIESLAARIARAFRPERIVLFGSHAYGQPTPDSDVDLLVIMPFAGKAPCQATRIRQAVEPSFGLDLIVRKPEQVRQRLALGDFFLKEITEKGHILYDAAHPGMDREG